MDKGRVLVIDDDRGVTRVLRRILANEFDAVVVETAAQALPLLVNSRSFDAIICDVHMNGISGPALRDHLRAMAPGLLPRMIFMTGNGDSTLSREIADHFVIEKPFEWTALKSLVRSVVTASQDGYFPRHA